MKNVIEETLDELLSRNYKVVGGNVKMLRKYSKKTQTKFSEEVGLSMDTYKKVEGGTYVSLRTLGKISRKTGVEIMEFFRQDFDPAKVIRNTYINSGDTLTLSNLRALGYTMRFYKDEFSKIDLEERAKMLNLLNTVITDLQNMPISPDIQPQVNNLMT